MSTKETISQIFCIFVIVLFTSPGHTRSSPCYSNSNDVADVKQSKKELGTFSNRLYSELIKANPEKNVFYSPFSIETCLAMTRMGAEGETGRELDRGLAVSTKASKDLAHHYHDILEKYESSLLLKIANIILINEGYKIQRPFYELLTQQFFSSITAVNFANPEPAAKLINKWVERNTNNSIKDLVSPSSLNAETRLVLVSAIHFKGEWVNAFSEDETSEADFYLNESNKFKVQMMYQKGSFKYVDLPSLDAAALEMRYRDSDLSMLIVLPNSRTGLPALEEKLKTIPLSELTKDMQVVEVAVQMPKFKHVFEAELSQPLTNMGMSRMFSSDAEFTKILEPIEGVHLSSIVHKAFIEVNEKGAEAAAATASMLVDRIESDDVPFYVNRPFYYTIKDENNTKLFEGRIKNKF